MFKNTKPDMTFQKLVDNLHKLFTKSFEISGVGKVARLDL